MSDAIERLEAIEEIRRLKARYWRFVDTKQWERFGELWAPDATFTDHSAAFHCDGAQEVRDKIAAALPDDVVTVHHGHQSEIEIESPDRARGIWAMEDYLIFRTRGGSSDQRRTDLDGSWIRSLRRELRQARR